MIKKILLVFPLLVCVFSSNVCAETFRSEGIYIIRSAMNNNYVMDVYYIRK